MGGVVSLGGRAVWPRARVSWRGETLAVLEGDIGWCWGLGWVELTTVLEREGIEGCKSEFF